MKAKMCSENRDEVEITITGTKDEIAELKCLLLGLRKLVPIYIESPPLTQDPWIPPNWKRTVPPVGQCTVADLDEWERKYVKVPSDLAVCEVEGEHYPSFVIQHLCGYGYTERRYYDEVRRLTSWGFECLRSRRGANGSFWELWLLPGFWAAKGDLAELVKNLPVGSWIAQTEAVVSFLCDRASFGTLDICVQRAAMVID